MQHSRFAVNLSRSESVHLLLHSMFRCRHICQTCLLQPLLYSLVSWSFSIPTNSGEAIAVSVTLPPLCPHFCGAYSFKKAYPTPPNAEGSALLMANSLSMGFAREGGIFLARGCSQYNKSISETFINTGAHCVSAQRILQQHDHVRYIL